MKKLIVIMVALFLTVGLFAQRGQHRMNLEQLKTDLNLSDAQVQKLEASKAAQKTKLEAIRNNENLDRSAKFKAMKEIREAQKGNLEEVLTEAQNNKLKAMRETKMADRKANKAKHRVAQKELHKKMKAYKEENIKPAMLEKRLAFENEIAAQDKVQIDRLRLLSAEIKSEHKGKMKSKKEGFKKEKEDKARRGKRGMKGRKGGKKHHKKGQGFLKQLKAKDEAAYNSAIALSSKYGERITAIHESMEAQHKTWKEDMKEIKLESVPAERKNKHKERAEKRKERKGDRKHKPEGDRLAAKRLAFLLMPLEMQQTRGNISAPKLKTYPNPTSGNNTLEFEVRQSGNVKIDLFSIDGKLIRTVMDENLESGDHKISVDLSRLENKMYYYNITDKTGTYTQKVVVR